MWLFTPHGFCSVVQHDSKADTLIVRFRAQLDAEWFVSTVRTRANVTRKVHITPKADYPFRVFLTKKTFTRWLVWYVTEGITYTNFKSAVATSQGQQRARIYHEVWHVLRRDLDHQRSTMQDFQSGGF